MIGILNRLKYVLPLGIKIMLYINYSIMACGYKLCITKESDY